MAYFLLDYTLQQWLYYMSNIEHFIDECMRNNRKIDSRPLERAESCAFHIISTI